MNQSPSTVGIVVLSWNRRERVLDCIARLERLEGVAITIIVVDNASSDGSVEAISSRFPATVLLAQRVNSGFVGGVNAGLSEAKRLGLTFAWLLNDDTTVEDDVLTNLMAFAHANPRFSIFSPVIRDNDSEKKLQFVNGAVDWRRNRLYDNLSAERFDQLLSSGSTAVLIGTALLINMKVIEKLVGFEKEFFAYWEDIDFCVRCAKEGFLSSVVLSATVFHDSPKRTMRPPHYFYYMLRNESLFWTRHAHRGARGWSRQWLAKALYFVAENRELGQIDNVQACVDGVWDGLHRTGGPRNLARPSPRWFGRWMRFHPYFQFLLLEGKFSVIVSHLKKRFK